MIVVIRSVHTCTVGSGAWPRHFWRLTDGTDLHDTAMSFTSHSCSTPQKMNPCSIRRVFPPPRKDRGRVGLQHLVVLCRKLMQGVCTISLRIIRPEPRLLVHGNPYIYSNTQPRSDDTQELIMESTKIHNIETSSKPANQSLDFMTQQKGMHMPNVFLSYAGRTFSVPSQS